SSSDNAALSPDERFVVVSSSGDGPLRFVERATGGLVTRLDRTGHLSGVTVVAFTPDGRHLATGGAATTILIRDFRQLCGLERPRPLKLDKAALEKRWQALAVADAKVGWQAVADLAACPEAVGFLEARLQPVSAKEVATVREHVKALDDDKF